jgi:hypothetical protein
MSSDENILMSGQPQGIALSSYVQTLVWTPKNILGTEQDYQNFNLNYCTDDKTFQSHRTL